VTGDSVGALLVLVGALLGLVAGDTVGEMVGTKR